MTEGVQFQTKTCTVFLPKGTVSSKASPEALQKGLKIRKAHIKGENATALEFLEV